MDANIESYPPKMEDTIMKSTESYLNNNDTLEHYNGHCADIGAYKDHLERQVHQIATRWMHSIMGEENQPSDDETGRRQSGRRRERRRNRG